MLCKLCQSKEAIQKSHIIPQFASEWIKKGWPSGGPRNVNEPDRRCQDTSKNPLLCKDCKTRLSDRETKSANQVFYPFSKDGELSFQYDEWFLHFSVSLSWRIGISLLHDLPQSNSAMSGPLAEALTEWSGYLLGQCVEPPPQEHHLFFDSLAHCPELAGAWFDGRYAFWTIDCFVASSPNEVAIYAKLPGMTFFAGIVPTKLDGWKNTQILQHGVMTALGQEVTYQPLWECMPYGVQQVDVSMSNMSKEQKDKIQARHDANLAEWDRKRLRS
jgi:hypothetical protein